MGTDPSLVTPCDEHTKNLGKKAVGEIGLKAGPSDPFPDVFPVGPSWCIQSPVGLCQLCPPAQLPPGVTFVQDGPEDGQAVVDGGAVPAAAPELVLALLDAQLHPLGHAGHDLDVVAAEAELLRDEAGDGAAEDGLGPQGAVLLTQGEGPAGDRAQRQRWGTPLCLTMPGPGATNYLNPAPTIPRGSLVSQEFRGTKF